MAQELEKDKKWKSFVLQEALKILMVLEKCVPEAVCQLFVLQKLSFKGEGKARLPEGYKMKYKILKSMGLRVHILCVVV